MSMIFPRGAVMAPHFNGLVEGENINDHRQYIYYIFRYAHGFTWHAAHRRRPGTLGRNGVFVHYLRATVTRRDIPPKSDYVVAAVNFETYRWFVRRGQQFWIDVFEERKNRRQAWDAANPAASGAPTPKRQADDDLAIDLAAVKHGHREVAKRDNLLHTLPANFDNEEYHSADDVNVGWFDGSPVTANPLDFAVRMP